jgi:ubiquinone/menaquinone biosynthesis C-methylase UbiE
LRKKPKQNILLADLGCGSGDMLKLISEKIFPNSSQKKLIGIDANPNIIEFAKLNISDYPEIEFKTINILSEQFKATQYDIITATLFFHHFSSEKLVELFSQLRKQATIGIVINDLHRHWLAYYSIKILTQWFSKSDMVKYDAPLSVLRGFSRKDLEEILEESGIKSYSLQWKWAFRWQLIIHTD